MRRNAHHSERGAALVTVLMIVAAMSVAAVAVTQAVTNSTQRARALDAQAQLYLYTAAAEEVAKSQLVEILSPLEGRLNLDLPGYNLPQIIPVDGGAFTVTARDATNCFDVNTLVLGGEGGDLVADTDAMDEYQRVLEGVLEEAYTADVIGLVSSLTDWMDSNSVPGNGGAEDSFYLGETPSYRTSSQPLASLEELRAIRGYEPELIERLRPLLCALPLHADAQEGALNINTLEEHHAPLLQQVFSDALPLEEAQRILANRPIGGWQDVESLLAEPAIQQVNPELIQQGRLGLVTSLVEVSAIVSYRDHEMTMRYLFETLPGRPVRTLRRERIG